MIRDQMPTLGPLASIMNGIAMKYYKSGIMDPLYCPKKWIEQNTVGVLMIGYGNDKTSLGKKKDYWLL